GAGFGEELEALFFHALKTVWTGARLESAAAQAAGSGLAHDVGDFQNLLPAFHGTRAGDKAEAAPAYFQLTHLDLGRFGFDLGAGHLVRRQDGDNLLDTLAGFQRLLGAIALLAQGGNNGALCSHDDVTAQTELLDPFDNVIDLFLRGTGFHD